MKIIELNDEHIEQVKDLLVELQEYVIEIDKYNLNIISPRYKEEYFNYMLDERSKNEGKVFVAINDDKILGLTAGYVEEYNDKDSLCYSCPKKGIVAELIVSKNSRNDGVGTLLLEKIEKYFKSIGCEYVQLDVFAYNENAKKFYYNHKYEDRMITMFKKI